MKWKPGTATTPTHYRRQVARLTPTSLLCSYMDTVLLRSSSAEGGRGVPGSTEAAPLGCESPSGSARNAAFRSAKSCWNRSRLCHRVERQSVETRLATTGQADSLEPGKVCAAARLGRPRR